MTLEPHLSRKANHKLVRALLLDQRGSAIIMVAVAIFAMFAFAVLAIEIAVLMTTRTQLHTAADAAALAGASGLAEGSNAIATARAINYASYNTAVQDTMRPVLITEADVTFPDPGVIRVQTHRSNPQRHIS